MVDFISNFRWSIKTFFAREMMETIFFQWSSILGAEYIGGIFATAFIINFFLIFYEFVVQS